MPRNLDSALAAELAKGSVRPFYLCDLTLASGIQRVWTGVGQLTWGGNTYSGLGELAEVGAVHESSGVQADGTTISLNVAPSQLAIPPLGVTPPAPPRATVAGESLAWALPAVPVVPIHEILRTDTTEYGAGVQTNRSGSWGFTSGNPLGANIMGGTWSDFISLEIPAGARITGVYPVVVVDGDGNSNVSYSSPAGSGYLWLSTSPSSPAYGPNIHSIGGAQITAFIQDTLPGGVMALDVGFIALAVYYEGTPLTTTSLLYEAMSDVRVGGPVKLWFGMLSAAGAIVGQPFLVFSGLVDEPTVTEDPAGIKIVLALESRLRNHARSSGRRYTAADQKLDWPNDSGFNMVEILEEISLRWGS